MKQSIHFIATETTYGSTAHKELVCADNTVGLVNNTAYDKDCNICNKYASYRRYCRETHQSFCPYR